MKRTFIGTYGDPGADGLARAYGAAEPHPGSRSEITDGRLALIAIGGTPPASAGSISCSLDGRLFDRAALAGALDLPLDASPEFLVASAYARWGDSMLGSLRGEFVLFLWDRQAHSGILVRDHLGTRAAFYHECGSLLTVGSEISDVLRALSSRPGPAQEAVLHYLAGIPLPIGSTLYEGIRQLPAGHYLSLARGRWQLSRYWTPRFERPGTASREELADTARSEIERAVSRRMGSSDQIAIILSGGLDSTALAAVAHRQSPGQVKGYAGVFPNHPTVDETPWITATAESLGLETACGAPKDQGLMANALEHIDLWGVPATGFGFWFPPLYRWAAADGANLLVTGDGGDELFEVQPFLIADYLRSGRFFSAVRAARSIPGMGDYPPWPAVIRALGNYGIRGALPHPLDKKAARLIWREGQARPWFTQKSNRTLRGQWSPTAWKKLEGPLYWRSIFNRLIETVPGLGLFDYQRREAERAGGEVSLPFFDVDLVTFATGIPPELSFNPYLRKPMLRASMSGLLPEKVRLRTSKTAFDELTISAVSDSERGLVAGLLCDPGVEVAAYVDRDRVSQLATTGPRGDLETTRDQARDLWRLASVECWLRAQKDPDLPRRMLECGLVPQAGNKWIKSARDL